MRIISRNGVDHLMYQLAQGDTAEIFDIVVNSERGKGTGTEMLQEMIKDLRKLGVKRIFAFTRDYNHLAHHYYEKNGFNGTLIPNFYPDSNATIYIKEI